MKFKTSEKQRAYQREYYRANAKKRAAVIKKYRAANPEKVRAWKRRGKLREKYGITEAEYNAIFDAQEGVCAICHSSPGDRRLAVDHDHETGVVRGLLCRTCNLMLGHAQDNPTILRVAADYLDSAILDRE